jgi:hypothetical protein
VKSVVFIDRADEVTEEDAAALVAAIGEAEVAAQTALSMAQRNLAGLNDARLEVETARDIAAASNQFALSRTLASHPFPAK